MSVLKHHVIYGEWR